MADLHVPQAYEAAFRTGSAEHLDQLYEPDGVLVPRPGYSVTGADRLAAHQHLLGFGGSMRARTRHAYVAGDIGLLIVDWTIEGGAVRMEGTATDVVRRGPDGGWRYLIDNPHHRTPTRPTGRSTES